MADSGAVRKAVVTAAGRGTRQFPATRTVQKELLTVVDVDGYTKPALQILLEEILRSGIDEVCVVANTANAGPIHDHFRGLGAEQLAAEYKNKEWVREQSDRLDAIGQRLTVVIQEVQEGYGHAIYLTRQWVAGEPFILMTGDHVNATTGGRPMPQQLAELYGQYRTPITSVARVRVPGVSRYGTARGEPIVAGVYRMQEMVEKPSVEVARDRLRTPGLPDDEYLCFYGTHVFADAIFDCLDETIRKDIRVNGEIQLATAQQMLLERGDYLLAELEGEQFDIGTPEGLVETQVALALQSPYRQAILGLIGDNNRPSRSSSPANSESK